MSGLPEPRPEFDICPKCGEEIKDDMGHECPPKSAPPEPAAREVKAAKTSGQLITGILNEWIRCFISSPSAEQIRWAIDQTEAYSAELRAERDDYRHKWNDVLAHEDKALANCRKLERSLLQARASLEKIASNGVQIIEPPLVPEPVALCNECGQTANIAAQIDHHEDCAALIAMTFLASTSAPEGTV